MNFITIGKNNKKARLVKGLALFFAITFLKFLVSFEFSHLA